MKSYAVLATVLILGALVLQSCGEDCKEHDGIICSEGAIYWIDSCGNKGEKEGDCECGCNAEHTACELDCKECETNDDCPQGYWCDRTLWECKLIN